MSRKQEWINKFSLIDNKSRGERIVKRISSIYAGQKARAKKNGQVFDLTLEELRGIIYDYYGKHCIYCNTSLTINKSNPFSLDHINPVAGGGITKKDNIQIICSKCNRRKDTLTHTSFMRLMKLLSTMPVSDRTNILRRLSVGGMHFKRGWK